MAKVLVIGRTGQVAQALVEAAKARDIQIDCIGRPHIDLEDIGSIQDRLATHEADILINAAAYTAVDEAETQIARAHRINGDAPGELARWAQQRDIPILHLSTDCVFDGTSPTAYLETDPPSPISVYGESKWDGEQQVAAACRKHLIVRVCWVWSELAGNFVKTMLKLSDTRETLTVVNDQFGFPTHAGDLADALLTMSMACLEDGFFDWGTYHVAGAVDVNRADQARQVLEEDRRQGGPGANVVGVSSKDYAMAAKRPLNARLDSRRTQERFGLALANWPHGLSDAVRSIRNEGATP